MLYRIYTTPVLLVTSALNRTRHSPLPLRNAVVRPRLNHAYINQLPPPHPPTALNDKHLEYPQPPSL